MRVDEVFQDQEFGENWGILVEKLREPIPADYYDPEDSCVAAAHYEGDQMRTFRTATDSTLGDITIQDLVSYAIGNERGFKSRDALIMMRADEVHRRRGKQVIDREAVDEIGNLVAENYSKIIS